VPEDGDARRARKGSLEQLKPFRVQLGRDVGYTREVPAGLSKTGDEPTEDGVGDGGKDYRGRAGRVLGRQGCGCTPRHDDVNVERDQLGGERGELLVSSLRGAVLKSNALALHIAKLAQPLAEGLMEQTDGRTDAWGENADPRNLPHRLGASGER
jgi:hypothetical protein